MPLHKIMMRLTLLGGLILLGIMLWRVGWDGLLESVQSLGIWLIPYLLLRLIPAVLHTAAWAACFPERPLPCRFWQLAFVVRAGSAINQVTPTADIGGEVAKVFLLEPFMSRERGTAAVVIDKASTTLSQMIYLALGMAYLAQQLALPTSLQWSVTLALGLIIFGVAGFVLVQRYGVLSKVVRRLAEFGHWPARVQSLQLVVDRLDAQFVTFYTQHPWRFLRSVLLHGAGHAFDIIKTYILLRLLLGPAAPGWSGAAIVALAVGALDQAFFFVPGRLGTLEGVRFVILSSLGVSQIYGLAFGLIARVEQLVWSGLGLAAYAYCTRFFASGSTRKMPVSSSS